MNTADTNSHGGALTPKGPFSPEYDIELNKNSILSIEHSLLTTEGVMVYIKAQTHIITKEESADDKIIKDFFEKTEFSAPREEGEEYYDITSNRNAKPQNVKWNSSSMYLTNEQFKKQEIASDKIIKEFFEKTEFSAPREDGEEYYDVTTNRK